jgi:hypothetical protein
MAKRRKKTKKGRRSRVSGKMNIDFTNILAVAAGAVGSKFIGNMIPDSVDAKYKALGKIALGVALPMLVKSGSMKNIAAGVGSGFIAMGAVEALSSFGILGGDMDMLDVTLNGDDDLSVVNENILAEDVLGSADDLSVVQGMDDEDSY